MTDNIQFPRQRPDMKLSPGSITRQQPPQSLAVPPAPYDIRSGHKSLRTFSPVNESGSFEFDRVIKSGELLKRTRRTKNWKPVYLVLRPNLLSIYKDSSESHLRHQLTLSEMTAVALQKDRKRKDHGGAFGLFSPSRNFHLEASTEKEAQTWVDLIRREARLDAEEEEIMFGSPGGSRDLYASFGRLHVGPNQPKLSPVPRSRGLSSSSSEQDASGAEAMAPFTITKRGTARQTSSAREYYSGNEQASYSDFSDTQGADAARDSPPPSSYGGPSAQAGPSTAPNQVYSSPRPAGPRTVSQVSNLGKTDESARVVWHGYLLFLKSNRGGVRQWRKSWVVLRPKTLALYKDEEEYAANLIINVSAILDAVEIDPISKAKQFCMQIIAEDRSYRFAVLSEQDLSNCLGGLKSLLAKRKDASAQRAASAATTQK